jgi:hypothetical protein
VESSPTGVTLCLRKYFWPRLQSLVLAGAAVAITPASAIAGSGCHKAAKQAFPHDHKARHAYKEECKAHYKAWKKAHKKHHHLFGK